MHILIVEDDQGLKGLLEVAGYTTTCADDGLHAFELAKEIVPDLIISDILMPKMDGFTLCLELKKEAQLNTIPLIFYTAHCTGDEDKELALSMGVSRFITKPIDMEELVNTIEEVQQENVTAQAHSSVGSEISTEALEAKRAECLINKLDEKIKMLESVNSELQWQQSHLGQLVEQKTADLAKAKEAAERVNQAKSIFLTNISHELRMPMHTILNFAQMGVVKTKGIADQEKLQHYFSCIDKSAQQLLTLLNDLLDLSKLEAGRYDFVIEEHDLKMLVKTVATELGSFAASKRQKINVMPTDENMVAEVDADKMLQVVNNILSNAIKFTPEDKEISISFNSTSLSSQKGVLAQEASSAIAVSISDQGIGLPKIEQGQVFDWLVQSSMTNAGSDGSGLGLAICKEIIKGHNGTIFATNNPEGGATFTFVVPRHQ